MHDVISSSSSSSFLPAFCPFQSESSSSFEFWGFIYLKTLVKKCWLSVRFVIKTILQQVAFNTPAKMQASERMLPGWHLQSVMEGDFLSVISQHYGKSEAQQANMRRRRRLRAFNVMIGFHPLTGVGKEIKYLMHKQIWIRAREFWLTLAGVEP